MQLGALSKNTCFFLDQSNYIFHRIILDHQYNYRCKDQNVNENLRDDGWADFVRTDEVGSETDVDSHVLEQNLHMF